MYKVIKFFTDLQDKDHPYNVGDTFPRSGLDVTEDRLLELSSNKNLQHTPLIEKVEDAQGTTPRRGRKPKSEIE